MKKIAIFGSIAIALLASICFTACNNVAIENPEPEFYTVKLGWTGEILDVSYEPMATRTATDDLYGIQVYSKPTTGDDTSWAPYAYGLFDDPSNITITLQSSHKYKFVATMVRDGKNRLWDSSKSDKKDEDDVRYGLPFVLYEGGGLIVSENFIYDIDNYCNRLGNSAADVISSDGGWDTYHIPNVERYYGELCDYIPDESASAKIDMKRTSFGAKFIVGGKLAVDGKLEIQIIGNFAIYAPKMELALTDGDDQISDIFTFYYVENAWAKDDYTENINVTFKWYGANGTARHLGTHKITFKRNTTTVVEVNLDNLDNSSDDGIEGVSFNIPDSETGDLVDGNTVTINDGEMQ